MAGIGYTGGIGGYATSVVPPKLTGGVDPNQLTQDAYTAAGAGAWTPTVSTKTPSTAALPTATIPGSTVPAAAASADPAPYQTSSYPQNPAGQWTDPYASSLTAMPQNYMEDAWSQYGGNYGGTNNSQGYYNSAVGQLGQPGAMSDLYSSMTGYGPSAGANALQGITSSMGGAGNTQQAFGQIGSSYLDPTASSYALQGAASSLGGPGAAQNAFDQVGSQYLAPSASSGQYATAQGQLGGPSSSQQYYQQNGAQYGAPTAIGNLAASNPYAQQLGGEALGRNAQQLYGNSTYSQNNLGNAMGVANSESDLSQHQGDISGLYNGANYVQGFQGANQSQLSGPGALEQFASSDLNRTNPYYDMLQKQQADTIDQAAAARGAYGAGGSLAAQAMGSANLRAQQYQQEGQLQGAAQQAQLARLGLGADVAGSASNERMGQGNALAALYQNMYGDRIQGAQLGLSATGQADSANMARLAGITGMTQAGDQATLGRLAGQTNLASDASSSALNYLNSGMNAANTADSSLLARQGLLGQLAGQSDSQRLSALAGYSNMANSSDASQLARTSEIGNLAGQADSARFQGLNGYSNLAAAGDASQLARAGLIANQSNAVDQSQQNYLNSMIGMAGGIDANSLAKLQAGSQMAGQADSQSLNYLNSYFNQANAAQNAGINRYNAVSGANLNSAALAAGLYGNFYNNGGQQSVEAGVGAVNAGVNGTATGAAASQQGNKNVLSTVLGLVA